MDSSSSEEESTSWTVIVPHSKQTPAISGTSSIGDSSYFPLNDHGSEHPPPLTSTDSEVLTSSEASASLSDGECSGAPASDSSSSDDDHHQLDGSKCMFYRNGSFLAI